MLEGLLKNVTFKTDGKGLTFGSFLLIVSSKDIISSRNASGHKINDIPQVAIAWWPSFVRQRVTHQIFPWPAIIL